MLNRQLAHRELSVGRMRAMWIRATGVAGFLALLALAPGAGASPLWTSTPAGPWPCSSSGNSCVASTGFNPLVRYWGAWANRRGNCTNYAAYRLTRNGAQQLANPMGNAAAWAATVRRTLGARHVNATPAVGAIAWWDGVGPHNGGGAGHVAYVEKVAGRAIYLSASSWNIGSSRSTLSQGSGGWPDGFLHIKDAPNAPAGSSPIGHLDRVAGDDGGGLQVAGWAFDPDAPTSPVRIQVWIDGKPGTAGATRVDLGWASARRPDVARAHRSAGLGHGFSRVIPSIRSGSHAVRVYALNRSRGGSTTYLGGATVRVPSTSGGTPTPRATEGNAWLLTNSLGDPQDLPSFTYGRSGDVPLVGDWNGDGRDTVGVYRPSDGHWYLTNKLGDPRDLPSFTYGRTDDIRLVGDWNGDGRDTVGVYRPSDGHWYLTNSLGEPRDLPSFTYGRSGDVPLVGDWNGDGRDTVGVYRPSDGHWYLTNKLGDPRDLPSFTYGRTDDIRLVGDWNGDGRDTVGVYRPSDGHWYLTNGLGEPRDLPSFT